MDTWRGGYTIEQSKRRAGVDGLFTPGGFPIEQPTYSIFTFIFVFDF